jgi:hypothetical protein
MSNRYQEGKLSNKFTTYASLSGVNKNFKCKVDRDNLFQYEGNNPYCSCKNSVTETLTNYQELTGKGYYKGK